MASVRVRPRFKILSSYSPKELLQRIETQLQNTKTGCYTETLLNNFVVLKINNEEQHFWSPQLSLSIDKLETGCLIRGLYSPKPTIWSMFVFLYTGVAVSILFIGLYGLSRLGLNMDAPILWLVPVLVSLAAMLYIIAQIGQKLGAQQMFELHHFFEEVIDEKVKVR